MRIHRQLRVLKKETEGDAMRLIRGLFAWLRPDHSVVRAGRRNIRGSASHHAEQMINCHYG